MRLRQNIVNFRRNRRRHAFRPSLEKKLRRGVGFRIQAEKAGKRGQKDEKGKERRQNRQRDMAGDRPTIVRLNLR